LCAAMMITAPARAAFHLWSIQEVYTNSSGTLQFIELVDSPASDPFGFQNSVNFQSINVSNLAGTQTNPYTVPASPTLAGNTLGHTLLFGTSGIQAAGAPAPDFTIPNGFLFSAGGTINFFGQNSGPYSAPTDGILSRTWNGGDAINSPMNYAGQTGTIVPVPEPALILSPVAAGFGGVCLWLRRRRTASQCPGQL